MTEFSLVPTNTLFAERGPTTGQVTDTGGVWSYGVVSEIGAILTWLHTTILRSQIDRLVAAGWRFFMALRRLREPSLHVSLSWVLWLKLWLLLQARKEQEVLLERHHHCSSWRRTTHISATSFTVSSELTLGDNPHILSEFG